MEDDETTLRIKEAFGESSDSEHDNEEDEERFSYDEANPNWKRITEINGLWLCADFLSPRQQISLLSSIDNERWFTEASHNQAMRFGDLPIWAKELSDSIYEAVLISNHIEAMPSNLLWREPLFDQLIVNLYQPGEGICAHVDLMRFEDGIAIVSLESSCIMHFTHVEEEEVVDIEKKGKINPHATKIPVHLTSGSLVLMSGEARYLWRHEINRKPGFQIWEEKEINQKKRTSITLRKLCKVE